MVERVLAKAEKQPAGDIVIMGGCRAEDPNYNGYEFNEALDLEAFVKSLARPHICATLDTCRVPEFNYISARRTGERLLDKLINRSIELAAARHNDRCYIYDYIAALALLHGERFGVRTADYRGVCEIRELYLLGE